MGRPSQQPSTARSQGLAFAGSGARVCSLPGAKPQGGWLMKMGGGGGPPHFPSHLPSPLRLASDCPASSLLPFSAPRSSRFCSPLRVPVTAPLSLIIFAGGLSWMRPGRLRSPNKPLGGTVRTRFWLIAVVEGFLCISLTAYGDPTGVAYSSPAIPEAD
jgi:hypothetical protein